MGERPAFLELMATLIATVMRALRRAGPAAALADAAPVTIAPPPIRDDELLDKNGRPLRGAALAARLAKIERARVAVPTPIAAAPVPERPRIRVSLPRVAVRVPTLSVRAIRMVAITTTMTFVFATIIGTTGIVSSRGTIALGASTTLSIISGDVTARSSDADPFQPLADGAVLHAGMTVRTGDASYAVLTYFEGSTVSLDPDTTLVIVALRADPDGSTVISMQQQIGRTWHSVSKLLRPTSKYEVTTPTATATVRGTMFAVGVELDPQGEVVSTVQTTEGAVATSKAPTPAEPQPPQVLVQPGFQVSVTTAAALQQPTPQPEPERKVTVTVGASAGVVLDPLGRANGIKNGKIVAQTPGAVIQTVDGKLVVTLPNIPDGKIATVVDPKVAAQATVDVATSVTEKGGAAETTSERVDTSGATGSGVTAVDVKKGAAVEVAPVTEDQKKDIAASVKVAEAPKLEQPVVTETRKPEDGTNSSDRSSDNDKGKKDSGGPGGGPAGGAPGFVPVLRLPTLPPIVPVGGDVGGPALVGKKDQSAGPGRGSDQQPPASAGPSTSRTDASSGAPPSTDRQGAPITNAQPKPDAPRNDQQAAKPADQPNADAPSGDKPKNDAPAQPANDGSKFVPTLTLPSLPLFGAATPPPAPPQKDATPAAPKPADDTSTKPAKTDPPRFDPPKLDLPRIPTPQPDKPKDQGGDRDQSGGRDQGGGKDQQQNDRTPPPTQR